jgi:tricarballylate dehydrogenase
MASFKGYDLIVVGSGFAGCMTTLNFLEECKRLNKSGRVALVEAGKEGERSGASKWTMAYLRLDKNLDFGEYIFANQQSHTDLFGLRF